MVSFGGSSFRNATCDVPPSRKYTSDSTPQVSLALMIQSFFVWKTRNKSQMEGWEIEEGRMRSQARLGKADDVHVTDSAAPNIFPSNQRFAATQPYVRIYFALFIFYVLNSLTFKVETHKEMS
jgi:hypothetical protein